MSAREFAVRTVAILLFPDVELLDFAGPYEVFSSVRDDDGAPLMKVHTCAEAPALVRCRNGLEVRADYTLDACPSADVLLIPGGVGTNAALKRSALVNWIAERSRTAELTTSVCTGAYLLAAAGIVGERPVTTYRGSIEHLRTKYAGLEVRANERWVDAGDIVTSAGVSAGIDMALHIVSRLYGPAAAAATAHEIEYDYWPRAGG